MRKVEIKGKELRKGTGIKERNEIEKKKRSEEYWLDSYLQQIARAHPGGILGYFIYPVHTKCISMKFVGV